MTKPLSFPRPSLSRRASRTSNPRVGRSIRAALALLFVTVLGGCNYRFGVPEPASEQAEEVLTLWQVSLYAAVALGVLVLAILAYSLIRHRRRNNELPTQTEGNNALEITYTIIPFIIVTALFFYGLQVQDTTTNLTDDSAAAAQGNPVLDVDVTGYQWNWRFGYPSEEIIIEPGDARARAEMVLPVDRTIRFNLVAADVNHAFYVPGFLTKRDLIPGVRNEIEVTPNRTGEYIGYCAEYCGLYHSDMEFNVRVVSQAEYDTWVAEQKAQVS